MAELPADSPGQRSDEPMTIRLKPLQPGKNGTAPAAQEIGDLGSRANSIVGDAANNEDQASTGEHVPAVERSIASPGDQEEGGCLLESVKKKKKRKSKKKGTKKATGFEEYYADSPITPAEALEEKKRYDPSRSFQSRIEECIQRFRSRRRLDVERTNMFNKYLFLGGIDSSTRQFTGMANDKEAMAEADREQIRSMTAIDFVGGSGGRFFDYSESENWEVDFEAVAKGYLSRTITDWYMFDDEANQMAADLVKNFLNYLLMHNVCPEYTNQIMAARHVCDIAPVELRYIHELTLELPGTFNSAARHLFCEGNVKDFDKDQNHVALSQFRLTSLVWALSEKAKQAREKVFRAVDPAMIRVVSTTEETYRVLEIHRTRRKQREMVDEQLAEMAPNCELKPAGFIRVVPTIIAHGWGNMPRPEEVDFSDAESVEFVLEDELLAKFVVGMKVHMTVCELNVGIHFIKEIHELRVSFDTFLAQYLMSNWKTPAINDRPPPSIHSPNSEEQAMMSADLEVED
ncbi:hypothetical protein GGS21DRAFT_96403 [Xylaria nigripes]|nr:hypothetical protein GGS21DRAFT_96403 [Xylaria nigripes]